MTFKVSLVSTTHNTTNDFKEVDDFRYICDAISCNDNLTSLLNEGNSKVVVEYNSVELFSFNEIGILFDIDFKTLINKIDLSLLCFSNVSIALQKFILNSENFEEYLDIINGYRFTTVNYIRFNDGHSYSINDTEADDFVNASINLKIENRRIKFYLTIQDSLIVNSREYSFYDIEEIVWHEIVRNALFEFHYKIN